MASILVTGHKGFIGRHLFNALKDEHEVVGLDVYGYEPMPRKSYDGIIHLAAVSRVSAGERDPVQCLQTNIIETARMLEIPSKWFILGSTCEEALNVYGFSKKVAEDYVRLRSKNYLILQFVNVYGPGMQKDKLLELLRRGLVKDLGNVFPFEHIHVHQVIESISQWITHLERGAHNKTVKLKTGVARNMEELERVAASY